MERERDEKLRQCLLAIHEIVRVWRVSTSSREDAAFALDSLHGFIGKCHALALRRGELRPVLKRLSVTLYALEKADGLEPVGQDYLLSLAHEALDAFWADVASQADSGFRRFLRALGF